MFPWIEILATILVLKTLNSKPANMADIRSVCEKRSYKDTFKLIDCPRILHRPAHLDIPSFNPKMVAN